MTKNNFLRNYIPIICVVISILFYATPSPWGVMTFLFPLSNLLALSCWLWLQPKFLSPLSVFILGLFANLYSPYPVGTEAVIWLLTYLSLELTKSIFPEPRFVIMWCWWFLVVIFRTLIMIMFAYFHFGVFALDQRLLYNVIFAIIDFPLYFFIFLLIDYRMLKDH